MIARVPCCRAAVVTLALIGLFVISTNAPRLTGAEQIEARLVVHGYVNRQPRTGVVEIKGARAAYLGDLPFVGTSAELSPDGTHIAFDSCRKPDRAISVARLDGSELRRVVDINESGCVDLRWSRDGSRLSYSSLVDMRLHVVDLETDVDTPLQSSSPMSGWHSWSPGGDAIVYEVGRGGSRRLDIIDLATWQSRMLVGKPQFGSCETWAPDWSPVGDRIAFTTCDRRLYVVNLDGTGLTQLATSAYAPRWSIDGTTLLFLDGTRLLQVPASGGRVRQLGVLPFHGGPFSIGPLGP